MLICEWCGNQLPTGPNIGVKIARKDGSSVEIRYCCVKVGIARPTPEQSNRVCEDV